MLLKPRGLEPGRPPPQERDVGKARRCALISFAPSGGPLSRVEEEGLDSPWTPCVLRVGGAPDSGPPEANRDWRNRDFLQSRFYLISCSHLRARRGRREATARACALPSPWRALARGPPPRRRSSSGACKAAAEKVSCQMQVSLCYSFLPSHSQYTF